MNVKKVASERASTKARPPDLAKTRAATGALMAELKERVSKSNTWRDPDDAPEWTAKQFERADLYHGDKLVRPGRPPSANPKVALTRCLFAVAASEDAISMAEETEIHRILNQLKIQPQDLTAIRVANRAHLPGLAPRK